MKNYEGVFILKPDLNKEELDKITGQIKDVIEKNKGVQDKIEDWGKKKMTYQIKKQKEGQYYFVNFHIVPEGIANMKKVLGLNESIIRILITKI